MKYLVGAFLFLGVCQSWGLTNSIFAEDNAFGAVVLLRNEAVDENNESTPGYCNGTFISENLIVTAAHCVSQAEALQQRETRYQIGFYKYVEKPNGEKVRIGYKVIHDEAQIASF